MKVSESLENDKIRRVILTKRTEETGCIIQKENTYALTAIR